MFFFFFENFIFSIRNCSKLYLMIDLSQVVLQISPWIITLVQCIELIISRYDIRRYSQSPKSALFSIINKKIVIFWWNEENMKIHPCMMNNYNKNRYKHFHLNHITWFKLLLETQHTYFVYVCVEIVFILLGSVWNWTDRQTNNQSRFAFMKISMSHINGVSFF